MPIWNEETKTFTPSPTEEAKTKPLSFRTSKKNLSQLERITKLHGMSMSDALSQILDVFLKNEYDFTDIEKMEKTIEFHRTRLTNAQWKEYSEILNKRGFDGAQKFFIQCTAIELPYNATSEECREIVGKVAEERENILTKERLEREGK